jgi:hypothetical protein
MKMFMHGMPQSILSSSRKRVIGALYRQVCARERTLRSTRGFRDLLMTPLQKGLQTQPSGREDTKYTKVNK